MRISVALEVGGTVSARLPFEGAPYVTILGTCGYCDDAGNTTRVCGVGPHHDHDTYRARAVTVCCHTDIGELRAVVSTIFGIDEDNRVLNGRPRVY